MTKLSIYWSEPKHLYFIRVIPESEFEESEQYTVCNDQKLSDIISDIVSKYKSHPLDIVFCVHS